MSQLGAAGPTTARSSQASSIRAPSWPAPALASACAGRNASNPGAGVGAASWAGSLRAVRGAAVPGHSIRTAAYETLAARAKTPAAARIPFQDPEIRWLRGKRRPGTARSR